MVDVTEPRWKPLGRLSPALFLAAGGLITGHAALRGVEAFTGIDPPPDVFGPAGNLLALLGLVGLYPALVDRNQWLARAAAGVAVVPLVGWVVLTAWTVGGAAGAVSPHSEVLPGAFYAIHMATVILTYGLFGAASLRTDAYPRTLGVLLFGPPVMFVVMVVGAAALGTSASGPFIVGSGLALLHLAMGSVLRADVRSDSDAPAGDPTAG